MGDGSPILNDLIYMTTLYFSPLRIMKDLCMIIYFSLLLLLLCVAVTITT